LRPAFYQLNIIIMSRQPIKFHAGLADLKETLISGDT
jgi:hypothetical protein